MNASEIRKIIREEIAHAISHEEFLTKTDAAKILKISKRALEYSLPTLQAAGMQVQRYKAKLLIRRKSLDTLIRRAAEREEPIFPQRNHQGAKAQKQES